MILLIDNYDSFVYNLARYVEELGHEYVVARNDEITLEEIKSFAPTHIIISPGPKMPDEAGISNDVIQYFGSTVPILGVCLGHQCIGQVYGGNVGRAKRPMHGKTSILEHNGQGIFRNMPPHFKVTRYHSLIVEEDELPAELIPTAYSPDGEIMAIQHETHPVIGVQFHPEAVLTQHGHKLLKNFLEMK